MPVPVPVVPTPALAEEVWIVSIRGKLGDQRAAQTYELARASLEITREMGDVADLLGPEALLPRAMSLVLRGITTGGIIEFLPETTGEINAALREKDAEIARLREENEQLRSAVRHMGQFLRPFGV